MLQYAHMTKDDHVIIDDLVKVLKSKYQDDSAGHGWLHFERVWKMAKRLAKGQQVNEFLIELGALLHDVDDYKFRNPGEDELLHTKALLSKYSIDAETLQKLFHIVTHVSFKGGNADDKQIYEEGKIVQDADRLDVLGAIGIARVFAYAGSKGHDLYNPDVTPREMITFKQYQESSPGINHFYEKILKLKDRLNTPQAKIIAEHRHKFIEEYLKEFWDEVRGES